MTFETRHGRTPERFPLREILAGWEGTATVLAFLTQPPPPTSPTPLNGGRRPLRCHRVPECCLAFHDVCSGTRRLRVNAPSRGALTAAYLQCHLYPLSAATGWRSPAPLPSFTLRRGCLRRFSHPHVPPPPPPCQVYLSCLTFLNYLCFSCHPAVGAMCTRVVRVLWRH